MPVPVIIAIAFLILFPLVAIFGWILDLPRFVKAAENFFELAAQWVSALFHVLGPLFMITLATNTGTLVWGVLWAIFGSTVLARRTGALWAIPGKTRMRDWWRGMGRSGLVATGGGVVVFVLALIQMLVKARQESGLEWDAAAATGWGFLHTGAVGAALIVTGALYIASYRTGIRVHRHAVRQAHLREQFIGILATVFVISPKTIEEAGFWLSDDDDIVLSPIPSGLAAKMTPAALLELDATFARVQPDWQVHEEFSHDRIVITHATEETLARREELARTGNAYYSEPSPETLAAMQDADAPTPSNGAGAVDLSAIEW